MNRHDCWMDLAVHIVNNIVIYCRYCRPQTLPLSSMILCYLLIVCWYSYSSSIQPFLRERTGALYTSPCEIRNVLIYREEVGKNEASVLVSGRQCRAKSGSCLSRTVQRVILWKMTAVSIIFYNVARWVYLMVSKSVSDSSFPQQDKKSNHCSLGRWNSFSSGYL
jgi:hypothetical protein